MKQVNKLKKIEIFQLCKTDNHKIDYFKQKPSWEYQRKLEKISENIAQSKIK